MAYDTTTTVVDDVTDNLASYHNQLKTAIDKVMSSVAYANYGTATTSSGTVTLTDSSFPIQAITPGTANVVLQLPAVGTTNHPFFVINAGTAAYTIQARNAGSVSVGDIIAPQSYAPYAPSGTAWYMSGNFAATINAATAKTTPVDADRWGFWDSVTGLLNYVTWANIKATFAAVFAPIAHSNASAAVHGLPASVNVLGNRSAAGEFVQRGTGTVVGTGTNLPITHFHDLVITFAVAFSSTPYVFVSDISAGYPCGSPVPSTTGFTARLWDGSASAQSDNINYLALGT